VQSNVLKFISLALVLFIFWLANSGQDKWYLVAFGVASTVFTVALAYKMGITDAEGHPIHLLPGAATYWPWLVWEIIKSAWTVTLVILNPKLPISPTLTKVRASQKSSLGIATYGNSITLTPGTITTNVKKDELTVHALTRAGAIDLEGGGMDKRVSKFEGLT
jgi:multicomponent Na+:H+ antiporter subunit E